MPAFELGLFTLLQWIISIASLVLQIQRALNRRFMQWLGELIRHDASLSPMHHQKPNKVSEDLETKYVNLHRLNKSTGREDDSTKEHHKTSNTETCEDLTNGEALGFSGFCFQSPFFHWKMKYELGTHRRRPTGKRSRAKTYEGSGTVRCGRARFYHGFPREPLQRHVELSARPWLVRGFPPFIKVALSLHVQDLD